MSILRCLLVLLGCLGCCSASAFPVEPLPAFIEVTPYVPTPTDHVVVSVYDGTENGIQGLASLQNIAVARSGSLIRITVQLGNALSPLEDAPKIDLGSLPVGRYTVEYSASNTIFPDIHEVTLEFSVSEQGIATAVEYYNRELDHYFITAFPSEIAKLDDGTIQGWSRTGQVFHVLPADAMPSDANSVCRFYGLPEAGLDSHFYSDQIEECDAVQSNWPTQWIEESPAVFGTPSVHFGVTACRPLYRLYDNRSDANHRYTVDKATRDAMVAKGWIPEGRFFFLPSGFPSDTPYAMCVPN